jgi:pyruvate formate lyase activating enzyme
VCPADARQVVGRWMSVDEVLAEVESDRVFFDTSGGGVTCSGGEPLSQPRFLVDLLRTAKARGLHTCVDTCGWAPRRTLLAVAPLTDLFLYDLKTMDESRHLAYTGLPLAPILANLAALAAVHHNICIRIPIVPGLTDDEAALSRAAERIASMPAVRRVDLLPYHRHGSVKFERLGRQYELTALMPPASERMNEIAALFREHGVGTCLGGSS